MDQGIIDINTIPKLQFEIHNQELKNCIKELHFQFKTTQKKLDKQKKDIELRVTQSTLSDLFIEVNSIIDIDASLLKFIPNSNKVESKNQENLLQGGFNKFGKKIKQVSDVMKVLYDKMTQLQKKVDYSEGQNKKNLNQKIQTLQGQLDDFIKSQKKQNRRLDDSATLNQNKYEQKVKQIESKTLWQITDCNNKLNDRINAQFVKDAIKQSQNKILNKIKETNIKNHIDPSLIDSIANQSNKLEKLFQVKIIELNARIQEIKDNILMSVPSKAQIIQEKIQNQKKFGNLQVNVAEYGRKLKNLQSSITQNSQNIKQIFKDEEIMNIQISKMSKLIQNLKLGDDFMKLMQNLDPHKLCDIDNSIKFLTEQDLKIQKEIQLMKRYTQKFRQKMQICNLLTPNDQAGGKLNKEEINKVVQEIISTSSSFKKIGVIQGQLYQFKSYGDMINQINKRISKIQKQFDIQGVIYGLRAVQEYIKKEMLLMNNKMAQLQNQFNEFKRKRPLSANNKSESKMGSSISYKKLLPVDCISCFQNPMQKTTERSSFLSKKY